MTNRTSAIHWTLGCMGLWAIMLELGCSTVSGVSRKPPVYSFQEPSGQKVEVTIGILSAANSVSMQSRRINGPSIVAFREAFTKNFYEMMVAKGMNTRGPFGSIDEMTFPDKKGSDLVVLPELDLTYANTQ